MGSAEPFKPATSNLKRATIFPVKQQLLYADWHGTEH